MEVNQSIEKVRDLLSQDDIRSSIKLLLGLVEYLEENKSYYLTKKFKNELIVLNANLNRISQSFSIGIIDWKKQSEEKNRLIFSLLSTCDIFELDLAVATKDKHLQMTSGQRIATFKLNQVNVFLESIAKE